MAAEYNKLTIVKASKSEKELKKMAEDYRAEVKNQISSLVRRNMTEKQIVRQLNSNNSGVRWTVRSMRRVLGMLGNGD